MGCLAPRYLLKTDFARLFIISIEYFRKHLTLIILSLLALLRFSHAFWFSELVINLNYLK